MNRALAPAENATAAERASPWTAHFGATPPAPWAPALAPAEDAAPAAQTSPWTAPLGATRPAPGARPLAPSEDATAAERASPWTTHVGDRQSSANRAAPAAAQALRAPLPTPPAPADRQGSTDVAAEAQTRPPALSSDDAPGQSSNQEAAAPAAPQLDPGPHLPGVGPSPASLTHGNVVPARVVDVSPSAPELPARLAEPPAPPIPTLLQLSVADPLGDWTLEVHRDGHNLNLLFSGQSSLADVVTGAGYDLDALVRAHGHTLGSLEFREAAPGPSGHHHGAASGSASDAADHGAAARDGSDRQTPNRPPVNPRPPSRDVRSPAAGHGSWLNRLA